MALVEGGGLATLATRRGSKGATVVVYAEPRLRDADGR